MLFYFYWKKKLKSVYTLSFFRGPNRFCLVIDFLVLVKIFGRKSKTWISWREADLSVTSFLYIFLMSLQYPTLLLTQELQRCPHNWCVKDCLLGQNQNEAEDEESLWCTSLTQCISIALTEIKGILSLLLHWKRGSSRSLSAKNAVSSTVEFQLFYRILTPVLFYPHGSVGLVWTITISFIDKYIFFFII